MRAKPKRRVPTAILVAVSVVLHVGFAFLVGNYTAELKAKLSGAELAELEVAPDVPFAYACTVDVGAMVAARLAYCASPMASEGCADEAFAEFNNELILCEMQQPDMPALTQMDPSEVRLISQAEIAKIKPMPLLPALQPQQQKMTQEEQQRIEEMQKVEKRQETRPTASAQIVEITQPELEMRPDKARYLSEYDSKVAKEKVARASTDKMVARPGRDTTPRKVEDQIPKIFRQPDKSSESGEIGRNPGKAGRSGERGLLAMRGEPGRSPLSRLPTHGLFSGRSSVDGSISVGSNEKPDIGAPSTSTGGGGEGGNGGDGGSRIPNLRPSDKVLQKMVGGGSVDKLDGVESGEFTALNSRRWKYASFFNRMKRRVAQNWHPAEVYMRRDPTGRVYGSKDRLTVLRVSLTPTGRLAKAVIMQGSGIDFLDDEAVRSFRAAQPFPNPPSALVDKDTGYITFSFGFHFQIDGPNDAWWKFKRF